MMDGAEEVAEHNHHLGGYILLEIPSGCGYWREERVIRFVEKYGLTKVKLHGCAYGLVSVVGKTKGEPILQPWAVATNSPYLIKLIPKLCPGVIPTWLVGGRMRKSLRVIPMLLWLPYIRLGPSKC